MKPRFFAVVSVFREWLITNHDKVPVLLVGFWKVGSGRGSMTWPESVDQALCFGWIDGVRGRIDDESYSIRFTPRRARSIWSAVNIAKVAELKTKGLMHPSGLVAYDRRKDERSIVYSYENDPAELGPAFEKQFKENKRAWEYFTGQPHWYRRQKIYWISDAKLEDTRSTRLEKLIAACEAEKRL
ncbi:MAG: YdeI/OmpD-associated family protein [Pyrinomonadaceae bacterium]